LKAQLFIPEILRREYIEQTVIAVADERLAIEKSFDTIQALIGTRDDFRVPSDPEASAAAEARLQAFGNLILGQPMTDELYVSAAKRVIAKKPPVTKTDHGYKDCLIWESILRLARGTEVRFVTHDKAFLIDKSLRPELDAEARDHGISVIATNELEVVFRELKLQGTPGFSLEAAYAALLTQLDPVHYKLINQWSLSSLEPTAKSVAWPYYTEDASRLYVTFTLKYKAGSAVFNGIEYPGEHGVELSGSFSWFTDTETARDLQVELERLVGLDGSVIAENRTVYLTGGALTTGRREIPFATRGALLDEQK
jgi:hypothetical protein